ncbi:hypothetical protein SS1G_03581 [Sclerotinia sclerotiorum 1980 UF-70]|uniref:Uncharacterized protein n=1 Tax=Sclerotinia sclerotiorum (strain ATCC 18683 / 1980 / Ss-1) TaxID=665079 RepID=A7EE41_SCLS1|nr:hypothetical protein SS1G_03581 [Sclerotinia sclerotiorum 1980 UF-70]EDO01107.1 hypothetical protein SS1G_03581 [Sclerotinia sclerotiorum 1980 UF-70]
MVTLWRTLSNEWRNAYGHLCAEAYSVMDCPRGHYTFSTALIWNEGGSFPLGSIGLMFIWLRLGSSFFGISGRFS